MWPRIPETSTQSRLRSVLFARATPLCIASVTPSFDVPVTSMTRYVASLMNVLLGAVGLVGLHLAAGGLDDLLRDLLGVVVVLVDDVLGGVDVAVAVGLQERGVVVDLDHVLPVAALEGAGRDRRDPEPPVELDERVVAREADLVLVERAVLVLEGGERRLGADHGL